MKPIIEQTRKEALEIFKKGLDAVDPFKAVLRHVHLDNKHLVMGNNRFKLEEYNRIFVVGAGKAVAPMAKAIENLLDERISDGLIVVKDGHGLKLKKFRVLEASHPVPDERGVRGTKEILSLTSKANQKDLVICLISGGGSALLTAPSDGISLEDKKATTKLLLSCGANIHEVNTVRKNMSMVKGGKLASLAYPATLVTLILSDVVGDDLDIIASGPTVPDFSTFSQAKDILKSYKVWDSLSSCIQRHIEKGSEKEVEDINKIDDNIFKNSSNILVGTNLQALEAAMKKAQGLGYNTMILSSKVEGEASEVAKFYTAIAKEILSSHNPIKPPACILAGGETTVTVKGKGKGGRNQEFALASALALNKSKDIVVLCAGTDGTDAITDAAGAIADCETFERAKRIGLDPKKHLQENDSYTVFKKLEDLVITGPTQTNVMDLYILLIGT